MSEEPRNLEAKLELAKQQSDWLEKSIRKMFALEDENKELKYKLLRMTNKYDELRKKYFEGKEKYEELQERFDKMLEDRNDMIRASEAAYDHVEECLQAIANEVARPSDWELDGLASDWDISDPVEEEDEEED